MTTNCLTTSSLQLLNNIDSSTESILELSSWLLAQKENLSRIEFKQLLQEIGWSGQVAAKYLAVGKAFLNEQVDRLKNIEPHTIFRLAAKKYGTVVDQIKQATGHITQQFVENLISTFNRNNRKSKVNKASDNPTIWYLNKDGSRSCIFPPIQESDGFSGTCVQRAMDEQGITAQEYLRKAIALLEAADRGYVQIVGNLPSEIDAIIGDTIPHAAEYIEVVAEDIITEEKAEIDIHPKVATAPETATANKTQETTESAKEVIEQQDATKIDTQEVIEEISVVEEATKQELATTSEITTEQECSKTNTEVDAINSKNRTASIIAAQLRECMTWEEVVNITSKLDSETEKQSWELLNRFEQNYLLSLKGNYYRKPQKSKKAVSL